MTDTQERVVRDEIAPGQIFGFLGRKLNNFMALWVVVVAVVAVLFYHHHTIKSLEARFENHDDHQTIKSLEARFENLDDHHTIKSLEARFENLEAEFGMLQRTLVPKNCAQLYKYGKITSGVYMINPDHAGPDFAVFCDQTTDGGGWTVVQKRLDGSVIFDLSWSDYKNGFGNLKGEFWLGLDKIHRLTKSTTKLRVDLEDFYSKTAYTVYDMFAVADESKKYRLSVSKYSGTAGDSLIGHHGYSFSTKDQDNDSNEGNCAELFQGGWWYHEDCFFSNLNGVYRQRRAETSGVSWYTWKRNYSSLKKAEMKIRPVEC